MVNWAFSLNQKYCSIFWTKPYLHCQRFTRLTLLSVGGKRDTHRGSQKEGPQEIIWSNLLLKAECYPGPSQAKSDFTVCFFVLYISVKTVMENWWGKQSCVCSILFIKASHLLHCVQLLDYNTFTIVCCVYAFLFTCSTCCMMCFSFLFFFSYKCNFLKSALGFQLVKCQLMGKMLCWVLKKKGAGGGTRDAMGQEGKGLMGVYKPNREWVQKCWYRDH